MVAEDAVGAAAAGASISTEQEDDSLVIPITSTTTSNFVEIFPPELKEISSSTLEKVLVEEHAELGTWAHAGLLYMQQNQTRDSSQLLNKACELPWSNKLSRAQILASAGIAALSMDSEEARQVADTKFTQSSKIDNLFPMQWMGRGLLHIQSNRLDQARFFFETTLKQCGQVLPALLGMACISHAESNYKLAQEFYAKAIRLFPVKSGASSRVGFGLCCAKLGQVDRAKAALKRALELNHEHVGAMVGLAILDMQGLDHFYNTTNAQQYRHEMEAAIKKISMAHLLQHDNAMVQNHLANHYFWKWTPLVGSVQATANSTTLTTNQAMDVENGDTIRIGTNFETSVTNVEEQQEEGGDGLLITIQHPWPQQQQQQQQASSSSSNQKVWKRDYDRVMSLAKGAYKSTRVAEMQAEALLHMARVYHVKQDYENAHKLYERSCKLAPDLHPARFGLAQSLIQMEEYEKAAAHLRLILGTLSNATDALAALGLLQVKSNKSEGLQNLKKAIRLEPTNPNLVLLEALALQQRASDYPHSLERYERAVELLQQASKPVPYEVLVNMGVLCHETKQYNKAMEFYNKALQVLDKKTTYLANKATLDSPKRIQLEENSMFYDKIDTGLQATIVAKDDSKKLKVTGENVSILSKGDHVKLGDHLVTEIVQVEPSDENGDVFIHMKHEYVVPKQDKSDKNDETKQGEEPNDKENKEDPMEEETKEEQVPKDEEESDPTPVSIFVPRENSRLENPSVISIAFNIARLHEACGRIFGAVELHKAILKHSPGYVNSYLRLACIARDCGALKECSEWLKLARTASPSNPEVLTLIGNLHLSLMDWEPAQKLFDQLLALKVPNIEAYAMLSLGTIYFCNLRVPQKYAKHLQYAADYYKRILQKDKANMYAANGLGTIMAEKGELFRAKEIFLRVRQVSGDTVADAHLNLGHVYLAQKKHPEALQMYESYMKRIQDSSTPVTSKSRDDDVIQILLYKAFAYFDWARQAEAYNDTRSAPADQRYKQCMEHLQAAQEKSRPRENLIVTYNLCMTKLQAANCVLQKLTRGIRRTAAEVQEALEGLEESLPRVQQILRYKKEKRKVLISTSMLQEYIANCKSNIESAKSHLEEERKKEEEATAHREIQRLEAEQQKKERELILLKQKEEEAKKLEEQEKKARAKMLQVEQLRSGWELEADMKRQAAEKKKKKGVKEAPPVEDEEDGVFDNEVVEPPPDTAALFEDSDDEMEEAKNTDDKATTENTPQTTEKDLFGDSSSDESDDDLLAGKKREKEDGAEEEEEQVAKKRRVLDDDDDED